MRELLYEIGAFLLFMVLILLIILVPTKQTIDSMGTLSISLSDTSEIEGDIYVFMYNRSGGLSSVWLRESNGHKAEKNLDFDEYWINEVSNVNYETEGYCIKDVYFKLTKENPIVSISLEVSYNENLDEKIVEPSESIEEVVINTTDIEEVNISDMDIVEIDKEDSEIVVVEEQIDIIENSSKETEKEELYYPLTYSDSTATITIYKEWYEKAWCYIAHLEFTDYSRFGTYCANGKYDNGYQKTSNAAKKIGAVFCVNGCYSAPYLGYGVIRSGVVCNDLKHGYVAGYSNVSGLFGELVKDKYNGPSLTELAETGVVTDTFCFGPAILVDGVVLENKDTSRAQRTFIGSNGNAGDIWIVVSDGRYNDGESVGLTYMECAQLLFDKGCIYGIPLDGGGSSTMVFQGEILNANGKKERAVVDFVYFK